MRGGRVLIIVGFIVLLGAAVAGFLLLRGGGQQPAAPSGEVGEGTAEAFIPPGMVKIVVSAQNIPRGTRITSDAVQLKDWPEDALPEGYLTDADDALDRIARVDIVLDSPITDGMLTSKGEDLENVGSDAALQIPSGKVAYALSVDSNASVAWAIQRGDHIDVLISLLLVDLDEEFQSALPNMVNCLDPSEEEGCRSGVLGRVEVLANGWVVNSTPREEGQRPRLVTQLTVQDAVVLRVGEWPRAGAPSAEEPAAEGEVAPSSPVELMTLVVTPQDAAVLKYAEELGASMDLVLRSASDRDKGLVTTEAVTLQYLLDRFSIEVPPKLPHGVSPAVRELQRGESVAPATGGGEQ